MIKIIYPTRVDYTKEGYTNLVDRDDNFIAEFTNDEEAEFVSNVLNRVNSLQIIEMQFNDRIDFGISTNGNNPDDMNFFKMSGPDAARLIHYLKSK